MRSPFAVFRKHQKVLLVVLTGLAMFAFIFLDQIQQSGGQGLMPLMGLMLGAGVFWIIGTQAGKPSAYAVAGAILGLGLGILGPQFGGRAAAVETTVGDLSGQELNDLVAQRRLANNFVEQAFRQANQLKPELASFAAQIQPFLLSQLYQLQFQLIPRQALEQDVVFGFLLRHEADRMGVVVGNDAVQEYIKQISTPVSAMFSIGNGPLTTDEFQELRSRFQVSETELFEILRRELQAKLVLNLLKPPDIQSPDQRWQDYRKINVKQVLEIEPVAVQPFANTVTEPALAELQDFFDQFKNLFPSPAGAPGFYLPRKVVLAYLEADYETVESTLPEVTQQEIEQYYEEHKEDFYKIQTIPEPPEETVEDPTPPTGDSTAPEDPQAAANQDQPSKDGSADGSDSKAGGKDGSPDSSEAAGAQAESSPVTRPANDGGAATDKAADQPTRQSPKTTDEKAAEKVEKGAGDGQEKGTQDQQGAGDSLGPACVEEDPQPAAAQPEPAATKPAVQPAADATAVQPASKPAAARPATDPAVAQPTSDSAAADSATDPAVRSEAADEPQSPSANTASTTPPPPALPRYVPIGPQYRPLDEDLRSEIRDQLLQQRTKSAMEAKIEAAVAEMDNLGIRNRATNSDDPQYLTVAQVSERLTSFAEANGLRYVVTKRLSASELNSSEEHSIGRATAPTDFPSNSTPPVVNLIFGNESEQLYSVQKAEDVFNTQNLFAYWVIEDKPGHVPTLEEDGVREKVLEAWRTAQGRPMAQKRAEELAEMVRQAVQKDQSMADALKDQTLTGETSSSPLSPPLTTPEFSWLTGSSVPQLNPFQDREPPAVSTIPGVENVDDNFMRAVAALGKNDVAVIPNADLSTYYVVQLKSRIPESRDALLALQAQFLKDDLFSEGSPYGLLTGESQSATFLGWANAFENRFKVGWNLQR